MKKTIFTLLAALLLIVLVNQAMAQVPQGFNYQAVARNSVGVLLNNQLLGVKLSLHQGSAYGTVVYSERQTPTTNTFGLFTVTVGQGTVLSGTFSTIVWSSGNYWLEVGLDVTGGTTYTTMGTSQLLTVPYAMYAAASGTAGATGPTGPTGPTGLTGATGPLVAGSSGQTLRHNGTSWVAASNLTNNGGIVTANSLEVLMDLQVQTALFLNALPGTGPMYVASSYKVDNLNVDYLDGIHASSVATANYLYPLDANAKIPNARLYAGTANGLDADMVDGKHASEFLTTYSETDPVFLASPAFGITNTNISNWNSNILPSGTSGQTMRHNGTNWVATNTLFNNGTNVGIGTLAPTANLEVVGEVKSVGPGTYGFHSDKNSLNVTGYGGYFKHTTAIGSSYGAYGEGNFTGTGNSASTYGGSFKGISTTQDCYGVLGVAQRTDPTASAAARGATGMATITGTNGSSYGLYGSASGGAVSYGVYGQSSGGTINWAGYFQGNINVTGITTSSGLTATGAVQLSGAGTPAAGKVLTSDATGGATWQSILSLPSGTTGKTLRHDGTNWVATSNLYNDGTRIGIGIIPDYSELFHIHGGAGQPWPVTMYTNTATGSVSGHDGFMVGLSGNDGDAYVYNFEQGSLILGTYSDARVVIDSLGKVGINTYTPTAQLHVVGTVRFESAGSPAAGKVLTSDTWGNATWQTITTSLPTGTSGQTLRHDGSSWVANSIIFNNGANVGIGTSTPSQKLDVNGSINASGQIMSTATTGTAPLVVASTTIVTNLNADLIDGLNSGNASGNIPVSNGTVNTNLNADMVDGKHQAVNTEWLQFSSSNTTILHTFYNSVLETIGITNRIQLRCTSSSIDWIVYLNGIRTSGTLASGASTYWTVGSGNDDLKIIVTPSTANMNIGTVELHQVNGAWISGIVWDTFSAD